MKRWKKGRFLDIAYKYLHRFGEVILTHNWNGKPNSQNIFQLPKFSRILKPISAIPKVVQ